MSAYLVSEDHIRAIVTVAASAGEDARAIPAIPQAMLERFPCAFRALIRTNADGTVFDNGSQHQARLGLAGLEDELGRALWLANADSLHAQYGERHGAQPWDELAAYVHKPLPIEPVSVIKQIHCYAYQACEVSDWATSWAKGASDALERIAIRALPGYEAAPWGL